MRTIDDLGLPGVIRELAGQPRVIVLLTGTTGSGKSTTLAAMIDHISSSRSRHVVTLEAPIEYLHRDKLSIINQREVGQDTESFAAPAAGAAAGPGCDPDRGDARRGDRLRGRLQRPDFKLMLAAQGQRASGIEQVIGNGDGSGDSLHLVKP